MMKKNEKKSKIQEKVLNASKSHDYLLLSLPTGVGKTLASLKVANDVGGKWLILCKEVAHINEWEKEIKKHKIKINADIICYDSLHKIKGTFNIICDEAHALTVKRKNLILKNINYNRIVFLTATLPAAKKVFINQLSKTKVHEIKLDLNTAIKLGILPAPEINVYFLKMNESQRKKYKGINRSISVAIMKYNNSKLEKDKNAINFLGSRRKNIVANFKNYQLGRLLNKLDKNKTRYICFTNSIEQLEEVRTSNSYIHSLREGSKTNAKTIEYFNKGKYHNLFTVKMLTESANLVDIQEGIITQLDRGKLTAIQRMGRVLRAYLPIIHIFVVKDTMDEKYLYNAISDIDKKYVKSYVFSTEKE